MWQNLKVGLLDKPQESRYTGAMQKTMEVTSHQLNIRHFPDDLKKRIVASAKRNRRSMAQEIMYGLERYLAIVEEKSQK